MTYLNIGEQLKVLFNTLIEYKLIILFMAVIAILTILYLLKRINTKEFAKGIILSIVFSLLTCVIVNEKALAKTFDNFFTEFFKNIYFPSVYIYASITSLSVVSTIVTFFNKGTKQVYKIINSIVFIINSILFILILNIIASNNIDVFSIESLYTNKEMLVALEVSVSVFLIWISAIVIAYSTNIIAEKIFNKEKPYVLDNLLEVPNILSTIEQKAVFIPEEEEVELPRLKQPEEMPIFNYFNTSAGNIYTKNDEIEIFSGDKYNLKLKEV